MQKIVNLYNASGLPGESASLNPIVYTSAGYIAESDVTAGNFVWQGTDEGMAKSSGSGAPLGLVERIQAYQNHDVTDAGSLNIPEESNLHIARKGDFFVKTTTAATRGQKVFAKLSNGSIVTGAKGATVSGAIETLWSVESDGAADSVIIISSWTEGA